MKIVTTRELRNGTKAIFELAEKERVAVKRGNKYVNLVVSDDPMEDLFNGKWARDFFAIPEEFRVNPFDISPSGDVFWADKRNIEQLDKALQNRGEASRLTDELRAKLFCVN